MPHLQFIFRKPKPLGTEFKVCADTETGIILYIEIQHGAGCTMKKEHFFVKDWGQQQLALSVDLLPALILGRRDKIGKQQQPNTDRTCCVLTRGSEVLEWPKQQS